MEERRGGGQDQPEEELDLDLDPPPVRSGQLPEEGPPEQVVEDEREPPGKTNSGG